MQETTEQLAALALLGTGRGGTLPTAPGAIGAAFSAAAGRAGVVPERSLLDAAAIALACGRAGVVAREATGPMAPAPPEELPVCSEGSAQVLARILEGEAPEVLPEWLDRAAEHRVRAPEGLLVPLLEAARRERGLRDLVRRAGGERGRWLASLNPDWRFATAAKPDLSHARQQWETGTTEDRVVLLREAREQDQVLARSLVESTWVTDPPEVRGRFVELFAIGLSMADEPFLEARLDDKRKAVRASAASLLGQLPDSRLIARMVGRALPLLECETSRRVRMGSEARISVTLPKERDAAMARDGIEDVPTRGKGKRAFLLGQMLNHVPPGRWRERFKLSGAELVRAALKSEDREVLLRSLLNAALTFTDGECARALLKEWVLPGLPDLMEGLEVVNAIEPAAEREAFVLAVLKRKKLGAHGLWWLLHAMRHAWSLEFSLALESCFEADIKVRHREDLLAPMSVAAMQIHPAALGSLIQSVEQHFEDTRSKRVDHLIAVMHLRHACWKEFTSR